MVSRKPVMFGSFSGCGGSSVGYKQAGFNVKLAIEFDPVAARMYAANHPRTDLLVTDIRQLNGVELLARHKLLPGELDLWEGSPPCSKFSMAGAREKAWNKHSTSDAATARKLANVEDLFMDWIRLLDEMQPRFAVAENVVGLSAGVAKGKLVQFVRAIEAAGYTVRVWKLRADRYGTPQSRQRLFVVCARNDQTGVDLTPPVPTSDPVAYGPAIADLPTVLWESTSAVVPSEHHAPSIERFSIARLWRETPIGGAHPKAFGIRRPPFDKPCGTIVSFDGNIGGRGTCHPLEPRRFSVAELKRICGFPDDYKMDGTYTEIVGRLGNSVPPPLAYAVAKKVRSNFR